MKMFVIGERVINKLNEVGVIDSINDQYIYVQYHDKLVKLFINAFEKGYIWYENEALRSMTEKMRREEMKVFTAWPPYSEWCAPYFYHHRASSLGLRQLHGRVFELLDHEVVCLHQRRDLVISVISDVLEGVDVGAAHLLSHLHEWSEHRVDDACADEK